MNFILQLFLIIIKKNKVVTCCFDKTGTLTRSNLRLLGIAGRADVALSSPDGTQHTHAPIFIRSNQNSSSPPDDTTTDDDDDDNDTDAAPQAESDLVAPVDIAPDSFASIVVSGCHALAKVGEDLIGDPLEASALAACGWSITGFSPTVATHAESGRTTKVRLLNVIFCLFKFGFFFIYMCRWLRDIIFLLL